MSRTATAAVLAFGVATSAVAQQPVDAPARRLLASRPTLQALAQQLDSIAGAPHTGGKTRRRAAAEAGFVRARLEAGDFRAGDRVGLEVVGEKDLTDTFTVALGPDLLLPRIGAVPLQGVLRSEIQAQLTTSARRIIRDPEVHARALIRVSVEGEVVKPGFVSVPPEAVVSDVLSAAGGLTKDAKLETAHVERGGDPLLDADELRQLMEESRTLDAVGIRSGDHFIVPRRGNTFDALRTAAVVLAIPISVFGLIKIF
jgi:protein involved in polysaccharide export with SLBB domain